MPKGDGSIIERKKGSFEIQLSFGRDPITGKYRKVSRTIQGTKADARKLRDQLRQDYENGLSFDGSKSTFGEFADRWFEARELSGDYAERTLDEDKRMLEQIKSYLSDIKMSDITPEVAESLLIQMKKDKTRNGKAPSNTTMLKYYRMTKQIFKKAVDFDLIMRNPFDRVKRPKPEAVERRSLSSKDASKLLQCLNEAEDSITKDYEEKEHRQREDDRATRTAIRGLHDLANFQAVRIGLATGMRMGEILGLDWSGVDFEAGTIKVFQALTRKGNIKCTKNGKPRTIAIDPDTLSALKNWQDYQAMQLRKLGIFQIGATPVVCNDIGTFSNPEHFSQWWRRFRDAKGFVGLRFHELRHTQATLLLANKVDVKTVQERLGHSSAQITLDCYAHALPENDQAAAKLVGELLRPKSSS